MKKFPVIVLGIAALVAGATFLLHGYVFLNIFTSSLPQGIYLKKTGGFERGEYALTCLDQEIATYGLERRYLAKGDCKTGIIPVGKIIKGVPGDTFYVDNGTLFVNNEKFKIEREDSVRRPIRKFYSDGENVLKPGEYLLLSDHVADSWDSRYWGPVGVEFLLKPWVIYEKK